MAAKKLNDTDNVAHQIINLVCDGLDVDEAVPACMEILDIALSHKELGPLTRGRIIGRICFRFGLEPPDKIVRMLT